MHDSTNKHVNTAIQQQISYNKNNRKRISSHCFLRNHFSNKQVILVPTFLMFLILWDTNVIKSVGCFYDVFLWLR